MAVKKQKGTPKVIIEGAENPVPVTLEPAEKGEIVNKANGKTLAPKTTEQDDLTTLGQRRINLIWEFTQATIAISITWAIIYCSIKELPKDVLTNAFFLIVSMYFVRTNHTLKGGVQNGKQKYEGR